MRTCPPRAPETLVQDILAAPGEHHSPKCVLRRCTSRKLPLEFLNSALLALRGISPFQQRASAGLSASAALASLLVGWLGCTQKPCVGLQLNCELYRDLEDL